MMDKGPTQPASSSALEGEAARYLAAARDLRFGYKPAAQPATPDLAPTNKNENL